MRFGVIGLDGECFVIAGHGLIQLPHVLEPIAKVVVRLGVIGLDGEGLAVARYSFAQLPKVLQCNA